MMIEMDSPQGLWAKTSFTVSVGNCTISVDKSPNLPFPSANCFNVLYSKNQIRSWILLRVKVVAC